MAFSAFSFHERISLFTAFFLLVSATVFALNAVEPGFLYEGKFCLSLPAGHGRIPLSINFLLSRSAFCQGSFSLSVLTFFQKLYAEFTIPFIFTATRKNGRSP